MEADAEDLEEIIASTYREMSRSLRIPGFRPGKAPRQVIDNYVGPENVRREAVEKRMGVLYGKAVEQAGISPISEPKINLIELGGVGPLVFEVQVEVKPEVKVDGYKGLEIERPDTEPTPEELDRALDEARERFSTLEIVEGRPVNSGDFVLCDLKVIAEGVPDEISSIPDLMVEVGSGNFLVEFEEQLEGARKGDILDIVVEFPPDYQLDELAGKPATCRTLVKEIKNKVLPPLDDELARQVSNFETLGEYREDILSRLRQLKQEMGKQQVRERVTRALIDRIYVDLPETMVNNQVEQEIEAFSAELAERDIELDSYLSQMKGTRHQLEKSIRTRVEERLRSELLVDAVADAEGIEITDEEAEDHIKELALRSGGNPDKTIKNARKQKAIPMVKASMRLTRAVDLMVEHAAFRGGQPAETGEEAPGETTGNEAPGVRSPAGEPGPLTGKADEPGTGGEKTAGDQAEMDRSGPGGNENATGSGREEPGKED